MREKMSGDGKWKVILFKVSFEIFEKVVIAII
jgi:hypothetical protein